MPIPTLSPRTQAEIIAETEKAWQAVDAFCQGLSPEAFHRKPSPELWSTAENLEHLFTATKPLVKALGAPKLALRTFGKPNRPGRSYHEIQQRYHERLDSIGGGRSVDQKNFAPQVDPNSAVAEHLEKWRSIGAKYRQRIGSWSEKDLDAYLLPHPLLGKVLVREMLYFTLYHTYHHLGLMEERVGG